MSGEPEIVVGGKIDPRGWLKSPAQTGAIELADALLNSLLKRHGRFHELHPLNSSRLRSKLHPQSVEQIVVFVCSGVWSSQQFLAHENGVRASQKTESLRLI